MLAKLLEFLGRLFRNRKQMIYGITVFVLLFLLAGVTVCQAEEPVLQIDIGSALVRGEAPTIALSIDYEDAGPGDMDYEFGVVLNGSSTEGKVDSPNQAGLYVMAVDGLGPIDIGLGVVLLQNLDYYNGSNGNFALMLGWNISKRWRLSAMHWSNAGTKDPNKGRDMLRVGFRRLF